MLEEIGTADNVESAVVKAKDKTSGFRLMGFGHRVYKNFDPRAKVIGEMTSKVLKQLGVQDPLLDVAVKLEQAALQDEYFVARKLYPNVDFYSGIIYKALQIPTEMFTVMFALGRTSGWVSHWLEQQVDPEMKIGRPRRSTPAATCATIRADRPRRLCRERPHPRGVFARTGRCGPLVRTISAPAKNHPRMAWIYHRIRLR